MARAKTTKSQFGVWKVPRDVRVKDTALVDGETCVTGPYHISARRTHPARPTPPRR